MEYIYEIENTVDCVLSLSLTQKEVSKYMDSALKKLKKMVPVGFSFEEKEQHDDFYRQLVNVFIKNAIAESMQHIVEKENIFPVSYPQVMNEQMPEYDKPFVLNLKLEILPQIQFPDFSQINLTVQEPDIPQHEIFMAIEKIMRPVITLEEVSEKRFPRLGDIVVCSVEASVEGKPFLELCLPELMLQVDYTVIKNPLFQEVEKICCVLYAGEQKKGSFVNNKDYPNPEFREKKVDITVTLHRIMKKIVPLLTDKIAQKLGFSDVKTLKTKVYTSVMNDNVIMRRNSANENLIHILLDKQNFVVPQSIYRFFLMEYLKEITDYLKKHNYSEKYIHTVISLTKDFDKDIVLENAKRHTYLLAYAYHCGIGITPKDLDNQLELIAKYNNKSINAVRSEMENMDILDTLKEQMMASKAFEKIYSLIKKIMVDAAGNPIKESRL